MMTAKDLKAEAAAHDEAAKSIGIDLLTLSWSPVRRGALDALRSAHRKAASVLRDVMDAAAWIERLDA
jgi:hypothetical protein